jgi:hypothetical protein
MLREVGRGNPEQAWEEALARFPDTAERAPSGWVPHPAWAPLASLVSLRLGVALLALTGRPEGLAYPLACGVALFNSALFHECHDALEPLWAASQGTLKAGLQGLILLAGAFHHQQLHNAPGMAALLEDALRILEPLGGALATPWGTVRIQEALEAAGDRRRYLEGNQSPDLGPSWAMARPIMELT